MLIDENLNWTVHINTICQEAKRKCARILNIFHTRDSVTMLTLFNSLVRSKLEYFCVVWSPCKKEIRYIGTIQRSFTKEIKGMKELNYWERLKRLNIKSLQRRREQLIIMEVFKIKNNINPNTINLKFKYHSRKASH